MEKDVTLLQEYQNSIMNRIEELTNEKEENKHLDTYSFGIDCRILELHSQWYKVQSLIIKHQ